MFDESFYGFHHDIHHLSIGFLLRCLFVGKNVVQPSWLPATFATKIAYHPRMVYLPKTQLTFYVSWSTLQNKAEIPIKTAGSCGNLESMTPKRPSRLGFLNPFDLASKKILNNFLSWLFFRHHTPNATLKKPTGRGLASKKTFFPGSMLVNPLNYSLGRMAAKTGSR